ncbi:MAG: RNA polymerase sigma factor [Bacteroidota bacterium]
MTREEYNKCVDLHADGLYRFILKSVRDKDKAKDIVQDTFEKVWLKVDEIDAAKSKSYLFTTGYRTMIDFIRRDNKQQSIDTIETSMFETSSNYSDLKDVLNKALTILPEIQRTVLLLRDYEGYNYQEIGEITNLSESQVKVYIFRARLALKEFIGKMEVVL